MVTITTVTDLRTWATAACGSEGAADMDALVRAIAADNHLWSSRCRR